MRRTNNTASKTYLKNLLQTKRIEISKFIHSPSPTKGFTSAKKNFSNDFCFRNDSFSNSGSKKLRRQMFISDHNERSTDQDSLSLVHNTVVCKMSNLHKTELF